MNVSPLETALAKIADKASDELGLSMTKKDRERLMSIISDGLIMIQADHEVPNGMATSSHFERTLKDYMKSIHLRKFIPHIAEQTIDRLKKTDKSHIYNYEIYLLKVNE